MFFVAIPSQMKKVLSCYAKLNLGTVLPVETEGVDEHEWDDYEGCSEPKPPFRVRLVPQHVGGSNV